MKIGDKTTFGQLPLNAYFSIVTDHSYYLGKSYEKHRDSTWTDGFAYVGCSCPFNNGNMTTCRNENMEVIYLGDILTEEEGGRPLKKRLERENEIRRIELSIEVLKMEYKSALKEKEDRIEEIKKWRDSPQGLECDQSDMAWFRKCYGEKK